MPRRRALAIPRQHRQMGLPGQQGLPLARVGGACAWGRRWAPTATVVRPVSPEARAASPHDRFWLTRPPSVENQPDCREFATQDGRKLIYTRLTSMEPVRRITNRLSRRGCSVCRFGFVEVSERGPGNAGLSPARPHGPVTSVVCAWGCRVTPLNVRVSFRLPYPPRRVL